MDIGTTVSQVRREYRAYLQERYPDWSDNTLKTHVSDAFYIWNNTLPVSLWTCLYNEESMEQARQMIFEYLEQDVHAANASQRAKGYYHDLCMLKEFMDTQFGGVKNRVGAEYDAESILYSYAKKAYDGELSFDQAVSAMCEAVPNFKVGSHRFLVNLFASMMEGKRRTWKANTSTTIYFIRHIGEDYGTERMVNDLLSIQMNAQYYYGQTGNKSNSICRACRKICEEYNLDLPFDDSIFEGIIPKQNTDKMLQDVPYAEADEEGSAEIQISSEESASYTADDFLQDVYMSQEQYNTLRTLLLTKKNLILQGAPGVGKTYAAKRLAFSVMGEKDKSRVKMVQFHQSYSYEDFIMGFRPTANGFVLKSGAFYDFCKKAENDDRDYFFIIDEINRGNLSKIFGELFMLIESDKRGVELQLLYSDEPFSIPSNVHIIGMMNTADRSLAMLDYALRRRFAFFEMKPAFAASGFRAYQAGIGNPKFDKLIDTIEQLNEKISQDDSLGEGFCIGHSYFCTNATINDGWLQSVVEYELIPLLKEYWFDEPAKVKDWSRNLREAIQ